MKVTSKEISPQRFAQGYTFQEYLSRIKLNLDRFQKSYEEFSLEERDASFFKEIARRPNGAAKVLALAEDWCPDVVRGLPAMARIAEAGIELRIFPRDLNLDIMDQFLYKGEFRSIPTFVFYTKDLKYIAHWMERPALAHRETEQFVRELERRQSGLSPEERRTALRPFVQERWLAWQRETVREIRQLLSS